MTHNIYQLGYGNFSKGPKKWNVKFSL